MFIAKITQANSEDHSAKRQAPSAKRQAPSAGLFLSLFYSKLILKLALGFGTYWLGKTLTAEGMLFFSFPGSSRQGLAGCFYPFLEEPAMFTLSARKLVRKIWGSSMMAIPPRPPVRPLLEGLEDRTLPSGAAATPEAITSTASPQAASAAAAITSYLFTMMEQRIAAIEQELSNALYTVGQVIAQEVYSFEKELGSILGINPNVPNAAQGTAATQPGSSVMTTTHDAPNPTLTNSPPSSGSGSGSVSGGTGHT